jgi:stalled ribosome alternative rescue factor ArfA
MGWLTNNIDPALVEYLFEIKIEKLKNIGSYQRNFAKDIEINFDLLEEQLQETPEMIAFWDMLLAEMKMRVETISHAIRVQRGKITARIINEAQAKQLEVKSTELKELINADPEMIRLELRLISAKRAEEKLKVVVEAATRKFDALRSLSGFKRVEKNQA